MSRIASSRPSAATARYSKSWSRPAADSAKQYATASARSSGWISPVQNAIPAHADTGNPSIRSAWSETNVKRSAAGS